MEPAVTRTLPRGCRLLLATHNPGKVHELRALLAPHGLRLVSAGELGLPEPEETGSTFRANALIKAAAAARGARLPALADDSGLEVAALGGAPGIHSARWAGRAKEFADAMARVRREMMTRGGWTAPGPHAKFIAVLCLAWPDGENAAFTGEVSGRLVWPPRGDKGFGYDPMFIADGQTLTFGEMEPDAKHAISHRARAFEAFCRACLERSCA
jgi:XTP/dITP diphosphohydrolase